jgi:hypothetical protein
MPASRMLVLLGLVVVALLFAILPSDGRRLIGWIAAAIVGWLVLYAVADLRRSFGEIAESRKASELIPVAEVKVDELQLNGTSPRTYEIRGLVHNLSPAYTLTTARFRFVVQDCVAPGSCQEQGRGHAEITCSVSPHQAAAFSTTTITMEGERVLPPPLGTRRLVPAVWLTYGK